MLSLAIPLVLPAALAAWGFWLEPASLQNEDYDLHLSSWPPACDGLRVAVLADLHVGSPHNDLARLAEVIELTQRANPDLVLLAGDFVIHDVIGGTFVAPERSAEVLSRLSAPAGVFAVLGNHDWWLGAERVRGALQAARIPVLDDTSRSVVSGDCQFWVAGVSDLLEGPHEINAALSGVPEGGATLLFTHNPDIFPDVPPRVSLTIAGHTHGGQVYVPGIGRPVIPSRFGERFAIGHIIEEGRHLFVSSGVGTSIIPVRFLVPPEVSVLHLRSPLAPSGAVLPGLSTVAATSQSTGIARLAWLQGCWEAVSGNRVEFPYRRAVCAAE